MADKGVRVVRGGVTSPLGFLANGMKCGIKKSGRKDLGLVYSHVPAVAAAAFTTNSFVAAPITVDRRHLRSKTHQAVIVNSGNANCANGKRGEEDARSMARATARALSLPEEAVLVASTGIIGRPLPTGRILRALPALIGGLSSNGGRDFADSIMTTDTVRKEACVKADVGSGTVTIGGAAKGVGMIYPNLAVAPHGTLLCFITTDACISRAMLERALSEAISTSFNMISVDGDMSTNDTVFILANGLAGNARIVAPGKAYRAFAEALGAVMRPLAKAIVADGEGVTKTIEVPSTGTSLPVRYVVTNSGDATLALPFGVEFNFGLLSGHSDDAYYEIPGIELENDYLDSMGEVAGVREVSLFHEWFRFHVRLTFDRQATLWRMPIETISNSEGGFERGYQCSCLYPHWALRLEPGESWEVSMRIDLSDPET